MADSRTPGSNSQFMLGAFLDVQRRVQSGEATAADLQQAQTDFDQARRIEDDPAPTDVPALLEQLAIASNRQARFDAGLAPPWEPSSVPVEVLDSLQQKLAAVQGTTLDPFVILQQISAVRASGSPSDSNVIAAVQNLEGQLATAARNVTDPAGLLNLTQAASAAGTSPSVLAALNAQLSKAIDRVAVNQASLKVAPPERFWRMMEILRAGAPPELARRLQADFDAKRTEPVDATFLFKAYADASAKKRPIAESVIRPQASAALQREIQTLSTLKASSDDWRKLLAAAQRRGAPAQLLGAIQAKIVLQDQAEAKIAAGLSPPEGKPATPKIVRDGIQAAEPAPNALGQVATAAGLVFGPAALAWWVTR